MHNPSISILGPGPDVMLIEGSDCTYIFLLLCHSGWTCHSFPITLPLPLPLLCWKYSSPTTRLKAKRRQSGVPTGVIHVY